MARRRYSSAGPLGEQPLSRFLNRLRCARRSRSYHARVLSVGTARGDPASVEAALAKRRLARDGGAYTLLFDEPGASGGSLTNVPVAIKDLIDVAGHPTLCGS